MRTIEYRTVDKSNWPRGPWDNEPDKVQWQDEATGLPCLIVRNSLGSLCGYVGVSKGHPMYEAESTDHLDVHGGITFGDRCQPGDEDHSICHLPDTGESDDVWWLGFDCGHAFDLSPQLTHTVNGMWQGTYRDIAYVREECSKLAEQLSKM